MATIESAASPRRGKGVTIMMRKSTTVDLTPMVDLGFLLITFFVLTTSMTKPKVLPLIEPNDSGLVNSKVCNSCALTLIPTAGRVIYYYEGMLQSPTDLHTTTFDASGLRTLLLRKRQVLASLPEKDKTLQLIVKPGDDCSMQDFTDIVDEVLINDIKIYFIAEPDALDRQYLPQVWGDAH